jgi:PTH2 family peptidyl-tRNA hydrolase
MRQLIIARKDLNMGPGKLAAQVAHASMAFITWPLRQYHLEYGFPSICKDSYYIEYDCEANIMDNWICGNFTKTICEAKNRNQLLKAKVIAEELGLVEGQDFFLIRDNCLTDLEPEEFDENGQGRTLTCIGFVPLEDEIAWKISKKFQLYK